MAKSPALTGLLASCLLLAGTTAPAWAQTPSVADMLRIAPKQKDVSLSTPTADEQKNCKVELERGSKPGWKLSDPRGRKLRLYVGSQGKPIEVWSYFKDGVEVYREIDTNGNNRPDQFRWLNTGGMKWGVDADEDGKIDSWRMISAEEAGQEAFYALTTGEFNRLKALLITDAEIQALKLPATEQKRLTDLRTQTTRKFEELRQKLPHLARAKFLRVEAAPPSCVLGEHIGSDSDLIKYASRSILYEYEVEAGKKKHEWLHTGEVIQVGHAWRLVAAPTVEENGGPESSPNLAVAVTNAKLAKLLEQLSNVDVKESPTASKQGDPAVTAYLKKRMALVEQILAEDKAEKREGWYKQLLDNLSAAAQNGDTASLNRLTLLRKDITERAPNSTLAPYATYREMWTRYALTISDPKIDSRALAKAQSGWLENLADFVKRHPTAEDTPDALQQLGVGSEFAGKDEEAKRWYGQIATSFPKHHLAEKAKGAVERLNLVGKELKLSGTKLGGGSFDIAQLAAQKKAVIVYYWASYVDQCVGDFARLKKLHEDQAGKQNFELVCVNLDENPDEASKYLTRTPVPGIHLHSPATSKTGGGLNSSLAVQYGINGLPTLFLVGRDGRVLNRSLQIGDVEAELKKAL